MMSSAISYSSHISSFFLSASYSPGFLQRTHAILDPETLPYPSSTRFSRPKALLGDASLKLQQSSGSNGPQSPKLPLPVPHKQRSPSLPRPLLSPLRKSPMLRPGNQPPSSQQLASLAHAIIALQPGIAEHCDVKRGVAALLEQNSSKLSRGSLAVLIRELGRRGAVEKATHVYAWMLEKVHLSPDDATYATLISVAVEARQMVLAEKLRSTMARKKVSLSAQSLKALVMAYARAGQYEQVSQVLRDGGRENDDRVNAWIYAKLIECASKAGNRKVVELLLQEMYRFIELTTAGGESQNSTFFGPQNRELSSRLIAACSKVGLEMEIDSLVKKLEGADCSRRGTIYNLGGRRAAGSMNGSVDLVNWTAIISAYLRAGRLGDAAVECWKMQMAGVELDLIAYRTMLQVFVEGKDTVKAANLLKQMRKEGQHPTLAEYNSLVGLYCKQGFPEKGKDVMKEMQMAGLAPNAETYNHVIGAFLEMGCKDNALQTVKTMRSVGIAPNLDTHSVTIEMYLQTEEWEKLELEIHTVQEKGMSLKGKVAAGVVRAYVRAGRWAQLRDLFRDLKVSGMREGTKFAFQQLEVMKMEKQQKRDDFCLQFETCCQDGHVENGKQILFDIQKIEGIEVSSQTYEELLQVCKRNDQLQLSIFMGELMRKSGRKLTVKMHFLLVEAYSVAGDVVGAIGEAQAVMGQNHALPKELARLLVEAYIRAGKANTLGRQLQDLKICGAPFGSLPFQQWVWLEMPEACDWL